jgi:dolichol-phosphate mannosyltransferase
MKVWVVLPAYNEAENLPALLDGFSRIRQDVYNLDMRILIINDGSTDNTAQVARNLSDNMSVEVFDNPHNMGLADTFMRGMLIAAEKADQRDVILCMDADNSHSPGLSVRMMRDIQEGRDVVIASRYQPGAVVRGVPLLRRFLSYAMSVLFRIVFPIPGVKDYSCGYRAYRAGFLQEAMRRQGNQLFVGEGFSCMAGLLLSLGREGAVCGEVPIILRYDQKAGASKMKVFRTIWRTLKMLFQERFRVHR